MRKGPTEPLALIHWERSGVPEVIFLDHQHRSVVESLLSIELKASSFRIVRERNEATGKTHLAEHKLEPGSDAFFGCIATRLTFAR